MFKSKVNLSKDQLQRIERSAKKAGYSSAQEFVEHVLDKELARLEEAESNEDLTRKLKGLGYLE